MVERYVDAVTGRSTKYAEKMADYFGKLQRLKDIVNKKNFPTRSSISTDESYTVTTSDSGGLLSILKKIIDPEKSRLNQNDYVRIAYRHLFQNVNKGSYKDSRIHDVNVLIPGDTVTVRNGVVKVTRTNSKYADFEAALYPWDGTLATLEMQAASQESPSVTKTPPSKPPPKTPPPALGAEEEKKLPPLQQSLKNWNSDHPDAKVVEIILYHDATYNESDFRMYFGKDGTVEKILKRAKELGAPIENLKFIVAPHSTDEVVYTNGAEKYIIINPFLSRAQAAQKILDASK